MEFFKIIPITTSEAVIQEKITPETVEEFTESMMALTNEGHQFQGVTLWGEFLIGYQKIKGGVRFALLDCPNALCWTITTGYPPEVDKLIIHCTINRTEKSQGFLEEVEEFLEEWETGLQKLGNKILV